MIILKRPFYERDTELVARALIGKIIIRKVGQTTFKAIITETEAYRSDDPACHGFRGRTERNKELFGPVGHTYVYLCYGIHHCLNFVSRDIKDTPAGGTLIRALRLVEGNNSTKLVKGPGNVAKALSVNLLHKGIDVTSPESEIIVAEGLDIDSSLIEVTGRIGISAGKDIPWRFVLKEFAVLESSSKT